MPIQRSVLPSNSMPNRSISLCRNSLTILKNTMLLVSSNSASGRCNQPCQPASSNPPINSSICIPLPACHWRRASASPRPYLGPALAGNRARAQALLLYLQRSLQRDALGDRSPGSQSEEHTSELQSLMRISYAVFCLKKKKKKTKHTTID